MYVHQVMAGKPKYDISHSLPYLLTYHQTLSPQKKMGSLTYVPLSLVEIGNGLALPVRTSSKYTVGIRYQVSSIYDGLIGLD